MAASTAGDQQRAEILELLERLHRHKDAAYGNAWRKRGEVIAIFANMARKYDRLLVAFAERRPAATEPLADTVADLCVYAGKYLTWIAEQHPSDLDDAGLPVRAAQISDARGPDALQAVLAAAASAPTEAPANVQAAWQDMQRSFNALERGLMAQATPGAAAADIPSYVKKAKLAWALVQDSAWLLTHLTADSTAPLDALREEVADMDRAARLT
jgi:hypothetical protein